MLYAVDLRGCVRMSALDPDEVSGTFIGTLQRAGATVVQSLTHHFPGAGLTCIAILAESHAVLHTWPETGTVNIDIFSCSGSLKSLTAIAELGRWFGAAEIRIQECPRADGYGGRLDRSPKFPSA